MGIFRDKKANAIGDEAQKAAESGQARFVARLNFPATHHLLSGEIPDWSMQVEAVERAGWTVEHFSVSSDRQGRPEAYVLFNRG